MARYHHRLARQAPNHPDNHRPLRLRAGILARRTLLAIRRFTHGKPQLLFDVRNPAGLRDEPVAQSGYCLNLPIRRHLFHLFL